MDKHHRHCTPAKPTHHANHHVFESTKETNKGAMCLYVCVRACVPCALRYGKLALVDLAGSERLKDTGKTEKGAVRETGAINKSLFTLGQVRACVWGLPARGE